ncbi:MAG: DoxX-like family protein [Kutzneria sp.]|nr:DoxX-like family protein [Kutzneria sp.]MBV9845636.1 DoxX-like family protein [Kutzneria sp.]
MGPSVRILVRRWVSRAAVAAVWCYEGLLAKVLGGRPDELSVVASVPFLPASAAPVLLVLIGIGEAGIGLWVLIGRAPRAAAVVQTVVIAGFNAGGLLFAADRIPLPGQLLLHNAVLLVLAWLVAVDDRSP